MKCMYHAFLEVWWCPIHFLIKLIFFIYYPTILCNIIVFNLIHIHNRILFVASRRRTYILYIVSIVFCWHKFNTTATIVADISYTFRIFVRELIRYFKNMNCFLIVSMRNISKNIINFVFVIYKPKHSCSAFTSKWLNIIHIICIKNIKSNRAYIFLIFVFSHIKLFMN